MRHSSTDGTPADVALGVLEQIERHLVAAHHFGARLRLALSHQPNAPGLRDMLDHTDSALASAKSCRSHLVDPRPA